MTWPVAVLRCIRAQRKIGQPTCPQRPNELWSIVCDAADRATFNVMLTPNYNAQHFNHVHVEVTPDAGWMLVH